MGYSMQTFFILTLIVLGTSCGRKTSSDSDDGGEKVLKKEKASIDAETTLTIDEGELSGTELIIPQGALAIGALFSVAETAAPASFTSDGEVVVATKPLRISATGDDGGDINTLQQPMTLSLPLGDSLGLAAIEKNEDNLCAFLETGSGDKYLWRRASLSLSADRKKVGLTSIKLGVFQIVFCGTKEVSGFTDVEQTEVVTGSKVDSFAIITIPASKFNFGQSHVCAGVASQGDDELFLAEHVGFAESAFAGKDVTLRFTYTDGKDSSAFNQDYAMFFISMVDSACEKYETVGDYFLGNDGNLRPNAITLVVTKEDILAGKVKGTLGQEGTLFAMKKMALALGQPNDTRDFSSVNFPELCLQGDEGGGGNYSIKVKSGKFYDRKDQELTHLYFPVLEELDFKLRLQLHKCADTSAMESDATERFYSISEKTVTETDTIHILPVNFAIQTGGWEFGIGELESPDSPSTAQNFCVSVYPASVVSSSESSFTAASQSEIFHMAGIVTTGTGGSSKTYQAPVFYYSENSYYLKTWLEETPVDPSNRCNSSNVNYVKGITNNNLNWDTPVQTATK